MQSTVSDFYNTLQLTDMEFVKSGAAPGGNFLLNCSVPFFLVRKREPVSEWCNIRETGLVYTVFEEKIVT